MFITPEMLEAVFGSLRGAWLERRHKRKCDGVRVVLSVNYFERRLGCFKCEHTSLQVKNVRYYPDAQWD